MLKWEGFIQYFKTLDYNVTTSVLAGAAGGVSGAVISKFKSFRNAGYNAFSKMYESCSSSNGL